jgi:ABC-2 type transport system permease protein
MMLKYLLEKECKQFFRSEFLPRIVLVFPVLVMLVVPWVTTMDIKDIRVVTVDLDRSASSRQLIRDIDASPYFILEAATDRYAAALRKMEYGVADALVEIPSDFEKELITKGTTSVQLSINTVNGIKGILGGNYLGAIMTRYSQRFAAEHQPPAPFASEQNASSGIRPAISPPARASLPHITLITHNRYNPRLDYKLYMIPALMVILLIVMCGFLPTLNIVSEKERGTIEQMNVTPVSKFMFITAKLIPYWMMGMLILTVCMALAYLVYGLTPKGNILIIYLYAFLFVLSMSGFGLVISNYSNTMQQAMFVMFFFVMIFQLMSGLLTPIRSMPEWAQWLTLFNPPRYFIQMIRLVYLKGGNLTDLSVELFALLGFVLFFNLWAVASYRKRG